MSINTQNVSNRLFDILVGSGHAIIMGNENGKKTLDPNEAVRFYIKSKHSMVYYNRLEGTISLSVGNNQRYDDVKDLIDAVKQTAKHYLLTCTVKNYGKKLEPKDFAFQGVNEDVQVSTKIAQPDTPEFKAWFGNSKVVDKNGDPMVVYHATTSDFSEFKNDAIYFTPSSDKQPAFHNIGGRNGKFREGTNVMPVYLKMTKPLIIDDKVSLEWAREVFADGSREFPQIMDQACIDSIQQGGEYDGVIFDGQKLGWGGLDTVEYIVFESTQIKSAIGNSGKFDSSSADITESAKSQTETPEFKSWFKNSKVVDKNGNPLVVYHGTTGDFNAFSLSHRTSEQGVDQYGTGYYMAQSPELAGQYTGSSGSIMPLYVRITKPMNEKTKPFSAKIVEKLLKASPVYRDSLMNFGDIDHYGEHKVLKDAVAGFAYQDSALDQINFISNDFWRGYDPEFLKALIVFTGYDGFITDGFGGKIFVAWSPTQIKSAIGNKGKFEPESENITESVNMTGTTKSSYQKMENAKIIIRHTKSVNEEIKGARSRSIQGIFIDNNKGERFAYPFKYLAGARALAQHVNNGGHPYDEKGQSLIKMAEQYIALKKFVSHANRSNFVNEETAKLVELAQERASQIGKAMKTGRGLDSIMLLSGIQDSERLTDVKNNFTKKSVNQVVDNALPFVLELLDGNNLQESIENSLTELVAAINNFKIVELSDMDDTDPDHPKNLKFGNSDVRNKHVAQYLLKHMINTDLRSKVEQLLNNYDSLNPTQKDSVVEVLRTLIRKAKVIKNEHVRHVSVTDNVLGGISESISKYSTSAILAKK